jgi:hypothetical protein
MRPDFAIIEDRSGIWELHAEKPTGSDDQHCDGVKLEECLRGATQV